MLRGDAALAALDSPHGPKRAKTDGWKGDIVGAPNAFVPPRDWDKWVNGLALNSPKCCLAGLAVLPTVRDPNAAPVAPAPSSKKNEAAHRKDLIHAQKGVSLRVPEAIELVDAVMNGRAHADYVYVGGQQHIVTTVVETNGNALCYAGSSLRDDSEVVMAVYSIQGGGSGVGKQAKL